MTTPHRRFPLGIASWAVFGCLLWAGCAAAPSVEAGSHYTPSYRTTPAPSKVDASAQVETHITIAPELQPVWTAFLRQSSNVDSYLAAMAETVTSDVAGSGLFARIQQPGGGKTDYLIRIDAREIDPANLRLQVTIALIATSSGQELFTRKAELPLGISSGRYNSIVFTQTPKFSADVNSTSWSGQRMLTGSMQYAFEQLMPVMKAGVAEYFQHLAEQSTARKMQAASLPELIVGGDRTVELARIRNRQLIAAKNQQLPLLLRERKTAELTDLVVTIEQAILDLNHDSEVAKDQAQQAAAGGESSLQIDEIRGLGICYRERIELLKPILGALKEEIANRNR